MTTATSQTHLDAGMYTVDPQRSSVSFRVRHLFGLGVVRGRADIGRGVVTVAEPIEGSSAQIQLPTAGIGSGNPARDSTVLSAAWLDAQDHPQIVFASTAMTPRGDRWVLSGLLTVRGATRGIDLEVTTLHTDQGVLRAQAHTTLDRREFGLTAARGLAGRKVQLQLQVVALATPRA